MADAYIRYTRNGVKFCSWGGGRTQMKEIFNETKLTLSEGRCTDDHLIPHAKIGDVWMIEYIKRKPRKRPRVVADSLRVEFLEKG